MVMSLKMMSLKVMSPIEIRGNISLILQLLFSVLQTEWSLGMGFWNEAVYSLVLSTVMGFELELCSS